MQAQLKLNWKILMHCNTLHKWINWNGKLHAGITDELVIIQVQSETESLPFGNQTPLIWMETWRICTFNCVFSWKECMTSHFCKQFAALKLQQTDCLLLYPISVCLATDNGQLKKSEFLLGVSTLFSVSSSSNSYALCSGLICTHFNNFDFAFLMTNSQQD